MLKRDVEREGEEWRKGVTDIRNFRLLIENAERERERERERESEMKKKDNETEIMAKLTLTIEMPRKQ